MWSPQYVPAPSQATRDDARGIPSRLLDRFQEWRDNLPARLANIATAEALDAVLELRGHVEEPRRSSCQRASDATDGAYRWRHTTCSGRANGACHARGHPHKAVRS
jgi:hypothetical protein